MDDGTVLEDIGPGLGCVGGALMHLRGCFDIKVFPRLCFGAFLNKHLSGKNIPLDKGAYSQNQNRITGKGDTSTRPQTMVDSKLGESKEKSMPSRKAVDRDLIALFGFITLGVLAAIIGSSAHPATAGPLAMIFSLPFFAAANITSRNPPQSSQPIVSEGPVKGGSVPSVFNRNVRHPVLAAILAGILSILGGVGLAIKVTGNTAEDFKYFILAPAGVRNLINDASRQEAVTETYILDAKSEYICMFRHAVRSRDVPLYTDSLASCAALIIDDPKNNKHYLGHFTAACSPQEIKDSIKLNFSDFDGLRIYIVKGSLAFDTTVKNMYIALSDLGLFEKARLVNSGPDKFGGVKVLIYRGKLMLPVENARDAFQGNRESVPDSKEKGLLSFVPLDPIILASIVPLSVAIPSTIFGLPFWAVVGVGALAVIGLILAIIIKVKKDNSNPQQGSIKAKNKLPFEEMLQQHSLIIHLARATGEPQEKIAHDFIRGGLTEKDVSGTDIPLRKALEIIRDSHYKIIHVNAEYNFVEITFLVGENTCRSIFIGATKDNIFWSAGKGLDSRVPLGPARDSRLRNALA